MSVRKKISFVLDGNVISLNCKDGDVQPTTTVLNYLRRQPGHKGVKEGCAEGDCGACTVALGEPDSDGTMWYKNVDSSLVFMPMLHGKQLITVENLKTEKGELHPVQSAMVETAGSQCGYCTPGIIMSLFSLYKNCKNPTRNDIDDNLTGNLCRCTGYKPIIEAAAKACVNNTIDTFTKTEPRIAKKLLSLPGDSVQIQTKKQFYAQPSNLSEAIELKNKYPAAIIINGATDVALRVTKRHELLKEVLDLSRVAELKNHSETATEIRLGTGIVLNDIMEIVQAGFPALYDMLTVFGSQQIRNLATLGGNVGTASPIGDTLPVLLAYNARVELQSVEGKHEVALNEYFTGYRKTLRKENELITSIIIPKLQNGTIVKSYKVSKRKDLDISTVSGGFRLTLNGGGEVKEIMLAYGGMAERPKRAANTEQFLIGKKWSRETVEDAKKLVDNDFTPISDARAGGEFRKTAARNLLLKFWSETKK